MHQDIRDASITVFKKHLLKEIQPGLHPIYNIWKPIDLKLLTRLRLGLSHLNEHRLIITLRTVLALCVLLVCRQKQPITFSCIAITDYYHSVRPSLFNELCETDMNLPNLPDKKFLNIILNRSSLFSDSQNKS